MKCRKGQTSLPWRARFWQTAGATPQPITNAGGRSTLPRECRLAHTSVLLLEGLGVGLQPVLTVAEAHIAAPKLRRVVPIRAHRDATSVSERATRWPDAGLGASCSRSHRG